MNNPVLKRIATLSIALLILFYVGYQIYRSHYSSVHTETASYFTGSESVQVNGFAVKDETLLPGSSTGVVDYVLSAGDKIAKGGTIAQIYSDSQQVTARHETESVDSEIKQIQALQEAEDTCTATPDALDTQIHRKITGILDQVVDGSLSSLPESRTDLQYLLNERQITTGKAPDFSARLDELQKQEKTLKSEAGTPLSKITSPAAGFFSPSVDGFETVLNYSKVKNLTCDQIRAALNAKAKTSGSGSAGKIDRNYDWYFVFVVSSGQAEEFRRLVSEGTVSLQFPFVSNLTIPASVAAVNQFGSDSPAAVILQCSYMNSALTTIRKETAQVIVRQYTGIRVSEKAIHFEAATKKVKNGKKDTVEKKNVSGVYVLRGNQISFRQVVPVYSAGNYVICAPNPDLTDLMTSQTVHLHDEVVVEGTDLYDGKVIQ